MRYSPLAFALLLTMVACSAEPKRQTGTGGHGGGGNTAGAGSGGGAGTTGAAGDGDAGATGTGGDAGTTGTGGGGDAGTTGVAGTGDAGTTGAAGVAGSGDAGATGGAGSGGAGAGGSPDAGAAGADAAADVPVGGDANTTDAGVGGDADAAGGGDADATSAGDAGDASSMDGGTADVPTTATIQINAGSTVAVAPFVADTDFTGGTTINHANTIDLTGVTNPAPAAVYQTGRTGTATYTIPGFTAGSTHMVRLHFAEIYWTMAAQRVFNVSLNGTSILPGFDVFVAAGAANKAVIREFIKPADGTGSYVIQLTSVTDKALVSAIEIY